ncbi:hypothetical protein F5Y13DRAFT_172891 [Hypoxylon sp. FL1857]|nr:hypothetical protein F5Y13DRAFT_172891 [Hypoxylon sp. FL1857]
MASTFHPFPRLPKELRDQIWDMAIRPDRPGAHFFSTVYGSNRKEETVDNHFMVIKTPLPYKVNSNFRIAAPGFPPLSRTTLSWVANNPSMYLFDSGLWSACKESRSRMMWRVKPELWTRGALGEQFKGWPLHMFPDELIRDMPATGYFHAGEGVRYFTVFPHQDLICIQPPEPKPFSLGRCFDVTSSAPFMSNYWGFTGRKNIAIEFSPEWVQPDLYQDLVNAILEDMSYIDKLWFIDYRIRQRTDASIAKRLGMPLGEFLEKKASLHPSTYRHVFYGSDRTFVEGDPYGDDWYAINLVTSYGSTNGDVCAATLIDMLESDLDVADSDYIYHYYDYDYSYKHPEFGILVCEPLATLNGLK